MHLGERILDVVERDGLADEAVEIEATLQVHVDEHREITCRQTVAVPTRLQRTPPTEEVEQRHLDAHLRCRYADEDHGAGEVARVERLLPRLGPTDRIDGNIHTEATRQLANRLDGV